VQVIGHQDHRFDVERPFAPAFEGDIPQQGAAERRRQDGRTG